MGTDQVSGRLTYTAIAGNFRAEVRLVSEFGEYQVCLLRTENRRENDGTYVVIAETYPKSTYYTDDYEDAVGTAKVLAQHAARQQANNGD